MATHEQEFAAEQPDPHRAASQGSRHILGHLDIGHQLDHLAIERARRRVQQARKSGTLGQALRLLVRIFGPYRRGRVDDDQPGVAVDDDPVVLAHQLAGRARTDHSRNVQAAGHDGGVRRLAAHIGHKTREGAVFEQQHVRRR